MNYVEMTKTIATRNDVHALADKLSARVSNDELIGHFNKGVTIDKYYDTNDCLIAYCGNTNKGTLISVWSRVGSKRREADYGVRISNELAQKLAKKSESLKVLLSQFLVSECYEDSNENRVSFYTLNDVEMFLETLFSYVAVANEKQSTKELNESETTAV